MWIAPVQTWGDLGHIWGLRGFSQRQSVNIGDMPDCSFSSGSQGSQLQAPELSGHCRASGTCQRERQIECPKECQNGCLKRCKIECQNMSDRTSERMSKHMPERLSDRMSYAICTSRWYVRNYVRIVFQGGGSSKKVIYSMFLSFKKRYPCP